MRRRNYTRPGCRSGRFQDSDTPDVYRLLGDPRVMQYSLSGPYDIKKTAKFIERNLILYDNEGLGLHAVIDKATNELIGYCGITMQEIDGTTFPEIGYRLIPDVWGRGYATEASRKILSSACESGRFSQLIAIIEKENSASIRVAEKIGLRYYKESLFHGSIPVSLYRTLCT